MVLPHLAMPNGEGAALIATGRADAVEMLMQETYPHLEYYRYLSAGYRLPLVGGTDKMSSAVPVGLYRTYAYIPPDIPFTYASWTEAVRVGRTFLSSGPMFHFTVNGVQLGDTITLPSKGTLEFEATTESIFPIHTLQIVQHGRVIASTDDAALVEVGYSIGARAATKCICTRAAGQPIVALAAAQHIVAAVAVE